MGVLLHERVFCFSEFLRMAFLWGSMVRMEEYLSEGLKVWETLYTSDLKRFLGSLLYVLLDNS